MKLDKYNNTFGYGENLLVEVQYIRRERRRLRGEVTRRNWEFWRFGNKGLMHVADAAMFISDGWMLAIDPKDFNRKLDEYQHPRAAVSSSEPGRLQSLDELKWIGHKIAQKLNEEGIFSFEDVANLSPELLMTHAGERHSLTIPRATEVIMEARKLVGWTEKTDPPADE